MKIEITLKCPECSGENIVKNGIKNNQVQNNLCNDCKRQFIGDHTLTYSGCHSGLYQKIGLMLVRNVGIRDIAEIENVSTSKVLSALTKSDKKKSLQNKNTMMFWKLMSFGLMLAKKTQKSGLYMLTIGQQVKL